LGNPQRRRNYIGEVQRRRKNYLPTPQRKPMCEKKLVWIGEKNLTWIGRCFIHL
jgi:hypothetical protein